MLNLVIDFFILPSHYVFPKIIFVNFSKANYMDNWSPFSHSDFNQRYFGRHNKNLKGIWANKEKLKDISEFSNIVSN